MLDTGIGLKRCENRQISARIPLQSPPYGGDSFPPGEAKAPLRGARAVRPAISLPP